MGGGRRAGGGGGGENDKANGDRDRIKGGNFRKKCSFGVICNDK